MVSRFFDYDDRLDGASEAALLPAWTDDDRDAVLTAEIARLTAGD